MNNYKGFNFEVAEAYVAKFGFESLDQNAFTKIVLLVEMIIANLVHNVYLMATALGVKVVNKKHFEALVQIMNSQEATGNQRGGNNGYVLPASYFGKTETTYHDDTSAYENKTFVDGLTRSELELKHPSWYGGGDPTFVSKSIVKNIVSDIIERKKWNIKISSSAFDVILDCVDANLSELFNSCKEQHGKKKVLTLSVLTQTLKKKANSLVHLAHYWKKIENT